MSRFHCVRIYNCGEAKHTMRDAQGLASWTQHNKQFRGGNGLFVNGECIAPGYLNDAKVAQAEQWLAKLGIPDMEAEQMCDVRDFLGGTLVTRFGYPDETILGYIAWEKADV